MNSSNAPFEIEYDIKSNYLHARVTAEQIDRTTWRSLLADVMMECARHRRRKLILERANAGDVAQTELNDMMADLLQLKDNTQIAFLNRHLLLAEEIADVVAYGAREGGNYRCFNSLEAAEKWLIQSEP